MENRVRFKIGEIEFEAEGTADVIERERSVFLNSLLPAAVEAIVRTRSVDQTRQYIEAVEHPTKFLEEETTTINAIDTISTSSESDYSRMNLTSYLKSFGFLTEEDFSLFAAYFDELKNGTKYFTKDDLENYYLEARRTAPSNPSMSLTRLAKKGLIMDASSVEQTTPKPYIVSSDGIKYIKKYQPKQETEKKITKTHKSRSKLKSTYSDINSDELNLSYYPSVRLLKSFKEKMIMVLYIISKEEKGEWFTTNDVLCLMTDIFGENATKDQVNGVFSREKLWFKSENVEKNEKEIKRKLLNKSIEFAQTLITNGT